MRRGSGDGQAGQPIQIPALVSQCRGCGTPTFEGQR